MIAAGAGIRPGRVRHYLLCADTSNCP